MGKIKVGVIGVGNCFSGLTQGIEYYERNPSKRVVGLMHEEMGGYGWDDLEFVSAFDVAKNKIGLPLHKAIYKYPNMVDWVKNMPKSKCIVREAPVLDGVGIYVENRIEPVKNRPMGTLRKEIEREIEESKTSVLVNYLPVGSQKATEFWAETALRTGCAFVNCMPVFIASNNSWEKKFRKAKLPICGDDIKSLVGSTIVHRSLAKLCEDRGTKLETTYQINVGGNSVTGDQEILLVHNGKTVRTRIGDFIDGLIALYGEKREDGKEIVNLSKANANVECFTVDENFNVIRANVGALIRHGLSEELYEIETYEGRKVKITKDHNLFALNGKGELGAVPVRLLREKESMIAVPQKIQPENRVDLKKVSLAPYLKEMFVQGITPDGNIIVHNHPEIKIPIDFPITDDLLQIVGLWLADGSFDRVGSSNIEIACGNDPECMDVIESFTAVHSINYQIRGQKQVCVRVMSKTMSKIFKLAMGLAGNSYTKRVPGWVFNLSERQIALVLRGYLSGDGTVTGKQIRWTTASAGLAEDIKTLLLMSGVNSTVFTEDYTKKKTSSFKTQLSYITHGIISSKEDVEAFIKKVGFIQSDKNRRATVAAGKLKAGSTHIIPKFDLLGKYGIRSAAWPKFPTLRARIILSQLNKVTDENDREKIRNICSGDVHFLKIKRIRKIQAEPQYVYDLSVPNYERFICSNILVHNTDFLNMKELERLESKKISKTESVQSQLKKRLPNEKIYVGPSDFIPFLSNTKLAFIRLEGRMWADIPFNMELRLEVDDKANSAGVVIDAVRAAQLGLDRGIGGALIGASSYLMKHPPQQFSDPVARTIFEEFISGKRER